MRGCASKSPSTLFTRTPCCCIARRCGPRAKRVTSNPARVMRAPRYAPIAPAPAIRNRSDSRSPIALTGCLHQDGGDAVSPDFARGRLGNVIEQEDFLGALELGKMLAAILQDGTFGLLLVLVKNHGRRYFLAEGRVRKTERHGLRNAGNLQQHGVDFAR